jgi:peptidoglycan/xylan/chitin deacetylase (PgdA/CDA1 family)
MLKSFSKYIYHSTFNVLKAILFPIIPDATLKKYAGITPLLPFYHVVSDDMNIPHVKHLYTYRNIKQFKDDIDFFLKNYIPLSLNDIITSFKNSQLLIKNSFLLTFDDGFREIYEIVAPILKQKGVPATFFLTSDFLDNKKLGYRNKASIIIENICKSDNASKKEKVVKLLAKNQINNNELKKSILSIGYHKQKVLDQIGHILEIEFNDYLHKVKPYMDSFQVEKLIKDGFTVGAHSIDHPKYSLISLDDQIYQTIESVNAIVNRFSLDYKAFSFPFSDYGVSSEFFNKISCCVDICFGSSPMSEKIAVHNLKRFWMENSQKQPHAMVKKYYLDRLLTKLTVPWTKN